MEWISVEKRRPEAFKKVLGYCGGDQVELMAYDGIKVFVGTDGCIVDYVSHWMEIPFPPVEADSDPCSHCRHHISWSEAQKMADRMNETDRHQASDMGHATRCEWTAEDAMCDHEMLYCIPCSRGGE